MFSADLFENTTCALVARQLEACQKHVPVWYEQNTFWRVMCLWVIFVTGIIIGSDSGLGMRYSFARLLVLWVSMQGAMLIAYATGHADGRAYSQ